MVALAILGIGVVALFQLFSVTLRSTHKADLYTRAIFYASSLLDEAYSIPDLEKLESPSEAPEGLTAAREVTLKSESEESGAKLYEITVTVTWPPSGSLSLRGLRTVYEPE